MITRDKWRRKAKRFAKRWGYFWLPCPLCGEEYGGHEPGSGSIPWSGCIRKGICPECTAERQVAAEDALSSGEEMVTVRRVSSSTGRQGPVHRIPAA